LPSTKPLVARSRWTARAALPVLLLSLGTACTPYAVHTTARPLARGERSSSTIVSVVPFSDTQGDSSSVARPNIDIEARFGIDDQSDVGIRVNGFSGAIVNYKRRLDGPSSRDAAATAIMAGAGFVNAGQHAHFEFTLLRSARDKDGMVPYGGLRAIQVVRLSENVPHDQPTIGLFGGSRFGTSKLGASVELGVFYDRSALGLRKSDLVIVPSVAVYGISLMQLWRGIF
jgi:hypothetical protein